MKYRYKTMDEIKDSRLLFDKKVPPFGFLILSVLTLVVGFLVYWSIITPKVSVIKAKGYVESKNKNYVMAPYSGQITAFNIKEGDVVKEGDALFTIKSSDIDMQIQQLGSQKEVYRQELELYNKYISCLNSNSNMFSSVEENEKFLYNKFEAYKSRVDQLKVDNDALRGYGYTEEQINDVIKSNENNAKQIYFDEIQGIEGKINELNNQISTIDVQMSTYEQGKEEYTIKATTSGKVHIVEDYKNGMLIQAGATVASIASNGDDMYIKVSVSETEAVKVKENQNVDIAVSGLSENIYGSISGKVKAKDTDVTINETKDGVVSYFDLEIEPDKEYVVSKSGEKVPLTNGMGIETRIKYDKVSYFQYALGALGLWEN